MTLSVRSNDAPSAPLKQHPTLADQEAAKASLTNATSDDAKHSFPTKMSHGLNKYSK